MNKKQKAQEEAVRILKEWGVVDGSTIYAKVNKVSASGMSRNISLYIVLNDEPTVGYNFKNGVAIPAPQIKDISYHAAHALEWGYKDGYNGGIRVTGVGMDMMFATIDALSYSMGYGAINQDNHDYHVKSHYQSNDCKECRIAKGETNIYPIGLKYKQL